MDDDNVTRFPGRRDRALEVLAAVQTTIGDLRVAIPSDDYAARLQTSARQAAELYADEEDLEPLVAVLGELKELLSRLRSMDTALAGAQRQLSVLLFQLAATPDEPRPS